MAGEEEILGKFTVRVTALVLHYVPNFCVLSIQGGRKELKNRWELIQIALRDNINNSYDLEVMYSLTIFTRNLKRFWCVN